MYGMKTNSQKSILRLLRDALEEWGHREKLTREVVADRIVTYYHASGAALALGIELKRPGMDGPVQRVMTTNMQKIWRWLDDQSKGTNLMPPNFVRVVLGAMPSDLRLHCVATWLRPLGLDVSIFVSPEDEACHSELMAHIAKECGEGVAAFANLAMRADMATLSAAEVEGEEAVAAMVKALGYVRKMMTSGASKK